MKPPKEKKKESERHKPDELHTCIAAPRPKQEGSERDGMPGSGPGVDPSQIMENIPASSIAKVRDDIGGQSL